MEVGDSVHIEVLIISCMIHTAMTIIGDTNITVGERATFSCLTDLNVQKMEWTFNGVLVASSSSHLVNLTFVQVVDHLHNREYICRAITSYGTIERTITISVHSKFT